MVAGEVRWLKGSELLVFEICVKVENYCCFGVLGEGSCFLEFFLWRVYEFSEDGVLEYVFFMFRECYNCGVYGWCVWMFGIRGVRCGKVESVGEFLVIWFSI